MSELGFIKFCSENIYLKVCSASFPRAQSTSLLICTLWIPFRVCCRSVTAVANDSILVEPDGKWHFFFVGSFTQASSNSDLLLHSQAHLLPPHNMLTLPVFLLSFEKTKLILRFCTCFSLWNGIFFPQVFT